MNNQTVYRTPRKIPSVQKHGFSAILLIALLLLSSFTWLKFYDKNKNRIVQNGPDHPIHRPNVQPGSLDTNSVGPNLNDDLNTATLLPDLMGSDHIPLDVNPTETLDLLGGPATNAQRSNPNGPRPPAIIPPIKTGPKTITINGQAVPVNSRYATSGALIKAPIQGLSRQSPFGRIPKIASNGRTALNAYARPFTPKAGENYISLIVGGLGLDQNVTRRAIYELPGQTTLSFASHAPDLQDWVDLARAYGHEVLLEIPMQSTATPKADHPLHSLQSNVPHAQNIKSIDYQLSRATGYFALTNYGGAHFVNAEKPLSPIIQYLKESGLGFVYDGEVENSLFAKFSKKENFAYTAANSYLDDASQDANAVQQQIDRLSSVVLSAQQSPSIPIGMGFSYIGSIDGILNWWSAKPDNIGLAPVSYALKINQTPKTVPQ